MQKLTTFIIFKPAGEAGKAQVLNSSILSMLGVKGPESALFTGVYGVKSNTVAYQQLHKGLKPGEALCMITAEMSAHINAMDYVGLAGGKNIEEVTALNLMRMRADLAGVIREIWTEALGAKYRANERKFPAEATRHAWAIEAIKSAFPHLKQIIYPVLTKGGIINVGSCWELPSRLEPHRSLPGEIVIK